MLFDLQRFEGNIHRAIKPQVNAGMIQVLGRKLQTRLQNRVKEEQNQVRSHLADLADKQAKACGNGLQ